MGYVILPHTGVEGLPFWTGREEVRKRLRAKFVAFMRSTEPCDHFVDLGLFAYYDHMGKLDALEFARPAQAFLDGVDLLGLDFAKAKSLLMKLGGPIEEAVDGATSYRSGVGVWAPEAKENPEASCESVIAFAEGYYDKA